MWTRLTTLTALLALLLTASGCPHPIGVEGGRPVMDAKLQLDPDVQTGTLDNGLTYYIQRHAVPRGRVEIWLAVNAGSMQEDDDQQGLAHFVEHMAFNGTEKYQKQEIVNYLESIGMRFGPDLNAYTSFDETVYMLRVPTEKPAVVQTAFDVLREWAHAVSFEDEEIDKERGVVLEEWRLGQGAQERLRDAQYPVLFKDSRYAKRLPIGDEAVIQYAPHDALRRFYRDWYRPNLMAVIVVGDVDPGKIERTIKMKFADLENPESPRPRETETVPPHKETLTAIATDKEATGTTIGVVFKRDFEALTTVEDFRDGLVEELFHLLLNRRYDEMRRMPDPPFLAAGSGAAQFVRPVNLVFQFANVREGKATRGLEALLTEVERVNRHGFTSSELERAKATLQKRYEQKARERRKQWSNRFASDIVSYHLSQTPLLKPETELGYVVGLLPEIQLDEVNGYAKKSIEDTSRVILYAGRDTVQPPSEQDLLTVFERVQAKTDIEPYVDHVRDEPLVADVPKPARIVRERTYAELGVTEWTLANGVRVVLKPTTFKNNEILLSAFSPGGRSLVADERYDTASHAAGLVEESGAGNFSRVELQNAIAGKVVSVTTYIGELGEGVSGQSAPADLETLLQLIYLRFTAPTIEGDIYTAWRAASLENVKNRLADPQTVFSDAYRAALYQNHPRRQPLDAEEIEAVDVKDALAFYKERFANAADFTFVLVGNFEPVSVKKKVRTWLGGLPADKEHHETWKDVGIRTPQGVQTVEVRQGLAQKSQVRVTMTTDAKWTREQDHLLDSLAQAMRIRLREVLREDLGGTYGVSVSGSIARRPYEHSTVTISFGCAPENVKELTEALFEEIEVFKKHGPAKGVVDKVREAQLRSWESQRETNNYWRAQLRNVYRYNDDPRVILQYQALVQRVTPASLQAAAQKYLNTERYVMGTLYPESTDSN